MAASVVVSETNGPVGTTIETLDPSNLNMGSFDESELAPATYPITAMADGHAYEKWLRFYVSDLGGSSVIDNFKVWISSLGGGWATGEGMSTNLRTTGYSAESYPAGGPINTNSVVATQVMPETEPGGPNIGIGGSLSGQIIAAPSYSDWVILQLDVTAATPAGGLNQKTLTFQWDEQ